jgi:hypothetical protein
MAFGVAMARLKRALIPHLMGQSAGPMRGLFEQIFPMKQAANLGGLTDRRSLRSV